MAETATEQITFSEPKWLSGTATHPEVLLVVAPGVLARAEQTAEFVLPMFRSPLAAAGMSADIVYASYADTGITDWEALVAETSHQLAEFGKQHELVIPVGFSFGALLFNQALHAGDQPIENVSLHPVYVDPPFGNTFPGMNKYLSSVAGALRHQSVLNKLMGMFTGEANLPKPENVGNAADFGAVAGNPSVATYPGYIDWVGARALEGLTGHRWELFASQTHAMNSHLPTRVHASIRPVYLACTDVDAPDWCEEFTERVNPTITDKNGNIPVERPKNDTVSQPTAVDKWLVLYEGRILVGLVRSTHCGFMERPVAWRQAFDYALSIALGVVNPK